MHFTKSSPKVALGNRAWKESTSWQQETAQHTPSYILLTKGKVKGEHERMFQVPIPMSSYGSHEAQLAAEEGISCQTSLLVQHLWSSGRAWP